MTDLLNWKHYPPVYFEKPQAKIDLLESIISQPGPIANSSSSSSLTQWTQAPAGIMYVERWGREALSEKAPQRGTPTQRREGADYRDAAYPSSRESEQGLRSPLI